ncbi:hypothetical protein D3C78_1655580 [compost metagenome]
MHRADWHPGGHKLPVCVAANRDLWKLLGHRQRLKLLQQSVIEALRLLGLYNDLVLGSVITIHHFFNRLALRSAKYMHKFDLYRFLRLVLFIRRGFCSCRRSRRGSIVPRIGVPLSAANQKPH